MGTKEIKADIYLVFIALGLILLAIAVKFLLSEGRSDLAGIIVFLIAALQGTFCLGFGAFTWLGHEDPEVWQD